MHPAIRRPKVVLIGDSAGGNLVLALARWIRDEGVLPSPDGMLLLSVSLAQHFDEARLHTDCTIS